jgi:hypothetical protein
MKNRRELEGEALEAVLVANSMGNGLGPRALELYQRTLTQRIRPLLLQEQAALSAYVDEADARESMGRSRWEVANDLDLILMGREVDAKVREIDSLLTAEWAELVLQLCALMVKKDDVAGT